MFLEKLVESLMLKRRQLPLNCNLGNKFTHVHEGTTCPRSGGELNPEPRSYTSNVPHKSDKMAPDTEPFVPFRCLYVIPVLSPLFGHLEFSVLLGIAMVIPGLFLPTTNQLYSNPSPIQTGKNRNVLHEKKSLPVYLPRRGTVPINNCLSTGSCTVHW